MLSNFTHTCMPSRNPSHQRKKRHFSISKERMMLALQLYLKNTMNLFSDHLGNIYQSHDNYKLSQCQSSKFDFAFFPYI